MSAALDSLPVLGAVGAVCGAAGTVIGKWREARARERAAKTEADARVTVAAGVTERHEITDRAGYIDQLVTDNRSLRAELATERAAHSFTQSEVTRLRVLTAEQHAALAMAQSQLRTFTLDLIAARGRIEELTGLSNTLRATLDELLAPGEPAGSD